MTKSVNVQFFALPHEIKSCLRVWAESYHLSIGHISLSPIFIYKALNFDDVDSIIFESRNDNYIVLSNSSIKIGSNKLADFENANPDALFIQVGQSSKHFLKESWMYSLHTLEDENSFKIWKNIVRDLKKTTFTGGWSIDEPTGIRKYSKSIRYTDGAKQSFIQGIKVLPSIGKNVFFELASNNEKN